MEDERVFLYDGETVRMSRMRTEQEARELARHNTHMIYFFGRPLDLLRAEQENS